MKLSLILLTSVLAVGAQARDFDTSGTRGGGETVDVNGKPTLRDLVDNTSCFWKTGNDVMKDVPFLGPLTDALGGVHWYYGSLTRFAIQNMRFCFTNGDLIQVDSRDANGITIVEERGRQVAVRVGNTAYVDNKIFLAMEGPARAYLIFHEAMHSFLALDLERRTQKMYSFVKSVEMLVKREISNESFLLQVEMNEIDWNFRELAEIDRARTGILLLHSLDPNDRVRADVWFRSSGRYEMRKKLSNYEQNILLYVTKAQVSADEFSRDLAACDVAALRRQIGAGFNPYRGQTTMVAEVFGGSCVEAMRLLLSGDTLDLYVADLRDFVSPEAKETLPHWLARNARKPESIRLLAERGMDMNGLTPYSPGHLAYTTRGKPVYKGKPSGNCTPLNYAAKGSAIEAALIAGGARTNASCESELKLQ